MTSLIVTGKDLHDVASWAARATPSKPTVPVLSGLVLDANGDTGELTVTGYDFETRASATITATITEPGRLLLSARLLAAIAKTVARDVDVVITEVGGAVQLRCGRSEWTLPRLPVEDFPGLPEPGDPLGAVNAGVLRAALERVLPALGHDDTLPMLTAVHVEGDAQVLHLIGTDRYRLAAATIPWQPAVDDPHLEVNLPGSMLDTALRAVAGDTETVSLHGDTSRFALATDGRLVVGRQLDVAYPRWRPFLVPDNDEHHAVLDVGAVLRALDQALVAADTQQPFVVLNFDRDTVKVSAAGDDRRAHADAEAQLVGDPTSVKVNAAYLRDALNSHGSAKVTLHFGATVNKPMGLTGEDDTYRHTLMPVRLDQPRSAA